MLPFPSCKIIICASLLITNEGKYLCNMELIFSIEEIGSIAKQLLLKAVDYKVFAFFGEMGAGKTTLIHALCEELGVRDHISSPTFSIINEYVSDGGHTVYHMDLYRLKNEDEVISSGVEDCLYSGNICLVEWPEKALRILPADALHIHMTATGADTRKLVINKS
jgi:tRNA threonylcarbamoyladenosine biosynthesis protein TsaE